MLAAFLCEYAEVYNKTSIKLLEIIGIKYELKKFGDPNVFQMNYQSDPTVQWYVKIFRQF